MAANVYECLFLLDSSRVAGEVSAAAEKLHAILEKHKVEILASRLWDDNRRLAYAIKKNKKAVYYLIYFRGEGDSLTPMKLDFQLNDLVIRSMILKIHPKLVDTMLALARDEHAFALHNYTDDLEFTPKPREKEQKPAAEPDKETAEEKTEEADDATEKVAETVESGEV